MSFEWPLRVYIEDTDVGGIVYYANYFRYLERARTEWLRSLGFSQEILRHQNILLIVRDIQAKYRLPARLDDELTVTVELESQRKASAVLKQAVYRTAAAGRECLMTATTGIACITQDGRPQAFPHDILTAMSADAGETERPDE
ncbi:MAG: tol-pal system-associated acyl-CoA thioesterase [Oceanospirillaceae bacterium]|nr:tol-pal system-associated acyl-CoA thioesterase [Oceanospirillaceae bacterium]|tara:strand:+ start:4387 stop:4818 length:432 start_codon:yes stop_codon:yes gene_type:complete